MERASGPAAAGRTARHCDFQGLDANVTCGESSPKGRAVSKLVWKVGNAEWTEAARPWGPLQTDSGALVMGDAGDMLEFPLVWPIG